MVEPPAADAAIVNEPESSVMVTFEPATKEPDKKLPSPADTWIVPNEPVDSVTLIAVILKTQLRQT
jgi:hypothetical protein